MKTISGMVLEFHQTYDVPVLAAPGFPPRARRLLRRNLLDEERIETNVADEENDLIEFADGLGDMVYIIYGTALEHGIDLDAVLVEIHRANMSKLGDDGLPVRREDGKVLKGPNYIPPDIPDVMRPARSEVIEYISLDDHHAQMFDLRTEHSDAMAAAAQAKTDAVKAAIETGAHQNKSLQAMVTLRNNEIARLNGLLIHYRDPAKVEQARLATDGLAKS